MEIAGVMLFVALLVLLAGLMAAALLVHVAARLSAVPDATFFKAVKAVVANTVVSIVLSLVFSIVPLAGTLLGMVLSLVATLWVFKAIYAVDWPKAFLLWLMQWVVLVALILIMGFAFGLTVFSL